MHGFSAALATTTTTGEGRSRGQPCPSGAAYRSSVGFDVDRSAPHNASWWHDDDDDDGEEEEEGIPRCSENVSWPYEGAASSADVAPQARCRAPARSSHPSSAELRDVAAGRFVPPIAHCSSFWPCNRFYSRRWDSSDVRGTGRRARCLAAAYMRHPTPIASFLPGLLSDPPAILTLQHDAVPAYHIVYPAADDWKLNDSGDESSVDPMDDDDDDDDDEEEGEGGRAAPLSRARLSGNDAPGHQIGALGHSLPRFTDEESSNRFPSSPNPLCGTATPKTSKQYYQFQEHRIVSSRKVKISIDVAELDQNSPSDWVTTAKWDPIDTSMAGSVVSTRDGLFRVVVRDNGMVFAKRELVHDSDFLLGCVPLVAATRDHSLQGGTALDHPDVATIVFATGMPYVLDFRMSLQRLVVHTAFIGSSRHLFTAPTFGYVGPPVQPRRQASALASGSDTEEHNTTSPGRARRLASAPMRVPRLPQRRGRTIAVSGGARAVAADRSGGGRRGSIGHTGLRDYKPTAACVLSTARAAASGSHQLLGMGGTPYRGHGFAAGGIAIGFDRGTVRLFDARNLDRPAVEWHCRSAPHHRHEELGPSSSSSAVPFWRSAVGSAVADLDSHAGCVAVMLRDGWVSVRSVQSLLNDASAATATSTPSVGASSFAHDETDEWCFDSAAGDDEVDWCGELGSHLERGHTVASTASLQVRRGRGVRFSSHPGDHAGCQRLITLAGTGWRIWRVSGSGPKARERTDARRRDSPTCLYQHRTARRPAAVTSEDAATSSDYWDRLSLFCNTLTTSRDRSELCVVGPPTNNERGGGERCPPWHMGHPPFQDYAFGA